MMVLIVLFCVVAGLSIGCSAVCYGSLYARMNNNFSFFMAIASVATAVLAYGMAGAGYFIFGKDFEILVVALFELPLLLVSIFKIISLVES